MDSLPDLATTPSPGERSCEHCRRTSVVLLEMQPGRGSTWFLCTRCWIDGLRKMTDNAPTAEPAAVVQPARIPKPKRTAKAG